MISTSTKLALVSAVLLYGIWIGQTHIHVLFVAPMIQLIVRWRFA